MGLTYSKYQLAIFDFLEQSDHNAIVEAVAGSGKSTTLEHGVRDHLPKDYNILCAAFNRHIAEAAQKRMPMNATSSTLNGFGWREAIKNVGYIKLDDDKIDKILRFDILKVPRGDKQANAHYYKVLRPLKRIIALIKARGESDLSGYDEILETHAIDTPSQIPEFRSLVGETLQASIKRTKTYDYNDQIYMPYIHNMNLQKFRVVVVDEAQDLNPLQIKFLERIGERIIAVGDRYQAIYGFRGADPWAMDLIKETYGATRLDLSVCYRCAKNIVREAQKTVPHIEFAPWAEEGIVDQIPRSKMQANEEDFILCRTTAPLVQSCLRYLRDGIKAVVLGRDIADDLAIFIQNVSSRFSLIENFKHDLDAFHQAKTTRLTELNRTYELQAHNDRVEAVNALLEDVRLKTVDDLLKKIDSIFSDERGGITHSTIHKSKGLEADRVFVLHPELSPHPAAKLEWQILQENNLKYVRDTRARKELYFVV